MTRIVSWTVDRGQVERTLGHSAVLSPWVWGGDRKGRAQAGRGITVGEWGHTGRGGSARRRVELDLASLPEAVPDLGPQPAKHVALQVSGKREDVSHSADLFSVAGCVPCLVHAVGPRRVSSACP